MNERRRGVLAGHIRGLREIIVRRGGFPELAHNPVVSFHLHLWVFYCLSSEGGADHFSSRYDLITAGEISIGLTPLSHYFTTGKSIMDASYLNISPNGASNAHDLSNMFICEFVGLYELLHRFSRSWDGESSVTARTIQLCLYQTFPFNSAIFRELAHGDKRPVFARLTILIHLSDLVLDLHRKANRKSTLSAFEEMSTFIQGQGLNETPCLWVLSWVLMVRRDTFQLQHPPRTWLTSRILWLAKRLSADFVKRVEEMLFHLLFPDASLFLDSPEMEHKQSHCWDTQEFASLMKRHFYTADVAVC